MNFKYYALWLIVWPFYLFDKLVHIGVKDYFWNDEFWFQRVLIWHDNMYAFKEMPSDGLSFLDEVNQSHAASMASMVDLLSSNLSKEARDTLENILKPEFQYALSSRDKTKEPPYTLAGLTPSHIIVDECNHFISLTRMDGKAEDAEESVERIIGTPYRSVVERMPKEELDLITLPKVRDIKYDLANPYPERLE